MIKIKVLLNSYIKRSFNILLWQLLLVVGYICETDTFGSNRRIAEISEEDILCFHNAGAYCFSMASNYNSRYLPAEVMIFQGKDYLIRKRQTIQDILHNQEMIEFSQEKETKKLESTI